MSCEVARRVVQLARIDNSPDLSVIATQVDVWCALTTMPRTLSWPNHRAAKSANGRWSYPNGRRAIETSGDWWYPSGRVARIDDGRWSYPNGRNAKAAENRWHRPDGRAVTLEQLLSWSAEVLGPQSTQLLESVQHALGDDKDAAIVELAWAAHNARP